MSTRYILIAELFALLSFGNSLVFSGEPLCKRFSRYKVERANEAVSPCKLFFYAERFSHSNDSGLRVIVERGKPIEFKSGSPISGGGLKPYSYRWCVLDGNGKIERAWLAHFIRNRDGTFHTIVKLPEAEWNRSRLEIYFADVDGDGEREDVT